MAEYGNTKAGLGEKDNNLSTIELKEEIKDCKSIIRRNMIIIKKRENR